MSEIDDLEELVAPERPEGGRSRAKTKVIRAFLARASRQPRWRLQLRNEMASATRQRNAARHR